MKFFTKQFSPPSFHSFCMSRVQFPTRAVFVSFPQCQAACGVHPIPLTNGYWDACPGFSSLQGQYLSLFHSVKLLVGSTPSSYPMGTEMHVQGSVPYKGNICLFSTVSSCLWGPPILLSNGHCGPFPWGGHEAGHSPPSSAEVKKSGAVTSSPICLHGILLNELSTGTTYLYVASLVGPGFLTTALLPVGNAVC
jgi:hypothetical protein